MKKAALLAHVNDNASGVWAGRVGQELVVVRPGANSRNVIVRWPQDSARRAFGIPTAWLDFEGTKGPGE
jgi:hypothetical protein